MPGVLKSQRETSIRSHRALRYLAYATGEILLIFVGITLAITFQNSNDERNTLELELEILESIQQNLEANLSDLNRNIMEDEESLQLLDVVLEHMNDARPWNDSLEESLGIAMRWSSPFFATSGYENLRQLGLHLVSDDDIRDQLVHLFENTYARLIGDFDASFWAFYEAVVLPVRNRELDRIDPSGDGSRALRVRDYEGALRRGELVALLTESRYLLVIGLQAREEARDETVELLTALQQYLSEDL